MKIRNVLILAILLLYSVSCRVTLVPSYSEQAVQMVDKASKQTDQLYDELIRADDKTFPQWEHNYAEIDNQIGDILTLDSSRKKSGILLILANDVKNRFTKYTNLHRNSSVLNNAELLTLKNYMHSLWESLYNSEINYKPEK